MFFLAIFTSIGDFYTLQDAILLFMIVKLRISSVTRLHDDYTIDGLLHVPCCVLLVILAVVHW